ncbi:MAG: TIGR01459 family HAD-type hydrolase [Hyphomonas sp.]|uniref:TIGR01459 family HAD-type hydrolase n=1 Tax=Hyphomonas sp. TaxID=87 RepID=UPI0017BD093F|nr:TIGR01459 family HAD-type hydrolase [Hyphomonas sp.]MBU3919920.1 TIGR01459 family HAD-type hydrolase [Alphaproteobacteria bacterium]MBA3067073.1 TIGR01459 family HAD-type hydrolase [Hyphomonas sp.]MBU4063132.1 TIGR01459 family HAD-type hydrolase [Alphaproteobacteria bacterium]MBU4164449.1 TIGR01459 family HAD-type hydrolase [Alphaproteobacteria bacterium]MBU4569246.1 TIGR01459 family HAD-type hydrolase [Alphaproteobacteria bacterium]
MTALQFPAGLSGLADRYDTILCDVWGVIHNGRAAFPEACDALVKFRAQGGQVSLITNAPVPEAQVVRYFEPLGVPKAAFDVCVSSGDATRAELAARLDMTVWRMGGDEGWEHDRFLYDGLGLTLIDNDTADLLLCIGLRDQANDQPEDYRAELARAVAKGLPMLCANPDKQVRVGGKLYWCAGALADIYEDLGGQVIYPGKPYAPIYQLAIARLTGLNAPPQRILCIGDSPATDVRGARLQGFDSLYVGTGLKQHGTDFEAEVTDLLADYGERATYAMTGLRW